MSFKVSCQQWRPQRRPGLICDGTVWYGRTAYRQFLLSRWQYAVQQPMRLILWKMLTIRYDRKWTTSIESNSRICQVQNVKNTKLLRTRCVSQAQIHQNSFSARPSASASRSRRLRCLDWQYDHFFFYRLSIIGLRSRITSPFLIYCHFAPIWMPQIGIYFACAIQGKVPPPHKHLGYYSTPTHKTLVSPLLTGYLLYNCSQPPRWSIADNSWPVAYAKRRFGVFKSRWGYKKFQNAEYSPVLCFYTCLPVLSFYVSTHRQMCRKHYVFGLSVCECVFPCVRASGPASW